MKETATPATAASVRPTQAKGIFLASVTALAVLALTGCGAIDLGPKYDKTATHEFDSGAAGKQQQVLPRWVPDEATNIKEVIRSTGNERMIRMDYAGAIPSACKTIEGPGKPTSEEIAAGLKIEGIAVDKDLTEYMKNQYETPLLSADWWPTGQETKTTHLCGKWWISQQDGILNAYTPESKTIADGILAERSKDT
ncbi:hypothetical protein CQ018_03990 [Arthrobacter sp. MYb227]|uniref:hypothetical protein n=1 Tax=Arthrobacter sp. MYb227 TaxID=1848601 RepID=UPI000CFBFE0D|nr:hypothetical protein [Arthrobacter sp. MYb227]PQZ96421.1 hypothetical protein CQ018_03990 [Arthrobacter sp. MYb227]